MVSSTIINCGENNAWKSDMNYRFGCVAYTGNGKIITQGYNHYRSCYREQGKRHYCSARHAEQDAILKLVDLYSKSSPGGKYCLLPYSAKDETG
tara:strand:- start:172 stop:453 length:282 start_codon:yes stop_codon:yes gene_type:complete